MSLVRDGLGKLAAPRPVLLRTHAASASAENAWSQCCIGFSRALATFAALEASTVVIDRPSIRSSRCASPVALARAVAVSRIVALRLILSSSMCSHHAPPWDRVRLCACVGRAVEACARAPPRATSHDRRPGPTPDARGGSGRRSSRRSRSVSSSPTGVGDRPQRRRSGHRRGFSCSHSDDVKAFRWSAVYGAEALTGCCDQMLGQRHQRRRRRRRRRADQATSKGRRGFVAAGSSTTALSILPGSESGSGDAGAIAINNVGQIVGRRASHPASRRTPCSGARPA